MRCLPTNWKCTLQLDGMSCVNFTLWKHIKQLMLTTIVCFTVTNKTTFHFHNHMPIRRIYSWIDNVINVMRSLCGFVFFLSCKKPLTLSDEPKVLHQLVSSRCIALKCPLRFDQTEIIATIRRCSSQSLLSAAGFPGKESFPP